MTSRSYFGKMNSTLGSVVPLAMFITQDRCQGAFIWVSGRRPPVNLGALSMTSLVDGLYLAMIEHYLQLVSSVLRDIVLETKLISK